MANRLAPFLLICTMTLSAGLVGCAALQDDSERVRRLQESTELMELRMTNFEDRLSLVEEEMGVLRSHGSLPEGARRVDPAPSLAKFPNLAPAGRHANEESARSSAGQATVPSTPESAPHAVSQDGSASSSSSSSQRLSPSPQAPVLIPPQAPFASIPYGVQGDMVQPISAQSGIAQPSAAQKGQAGAGTDLDGRAGAGAGTSQETGQATGMTARPGKEGASLSRSGGRSVSPVPVEASRPAQASATGNLRGLPSGFRTGVRAYDEALAMYYRHEYAKSRKAFTDFIAGNARHKLLPNALYWQGESAYSQADYVSAILSFKSITSQYPKHPKAADALLKIGMAYDRLKDPGNAQFYWQVLLDDFPKSSAARVARGNMRR